MSTTETDLDYLADRVRFFVDQEIPTVTSWNVDPHVLQDSLRRVGDGFTDVESDVSTLQTIIAGITNPDGTLAPVSEWVTDPGTPTYINASTFSLTGDQSGNYRPGSRIQLTLASGATTIATVGTVLFNPGTNQTVIGLLTPALTPALSQVQRSLINQSSPAARTVDILDGAVTQAKLSPLSVGTPQLIDGAVTSSKIAAGAVGSSQLAAGAVTNVNVGFKSLQGSTVLADNSINGAITIAPGSITGDRIAPGAIGAGDIADRSLPNTKLQYYTIRDTEIADGVIYGGVTRNHIVDKSIVASSKLQDRSIGFWDIAIGHVRGSWNGVQNEIGQGTIVGADIANGSLWANDKLANGSMLGYNTIIAGTVQQAQLAINAELYWVGVFRGGQVTCGQGGVVWLQNNTFPTRGGMVVAAFFVNGWMYAGGPTLGVNVAWFLDYGGNQGYNVTAHDPGETTGGPTYCPMTLCGAINWQPGAGNHTIGIQMSCSATPTKPGFSATCQNSDILVIVFS